MLSLIYQKEREPQRWLWYKDMTIEELKEELKETIKNLTDWEVIYVWNTYCRENYCFEDEIFTMTELNDIARDMSPIEILEHFGDMDTNDDYFINGIYGGKSFTNLYDEICLDDIVDYIARTFNDCYSIEIQEVLENFNMLNEDEE